jgi:hypothetical protein
MSESGLERSQGGGGSLFVRFAIHFRSRGGLSEAFAIAKKEGGAWELLFLFFAAATH